MGLTQNELERLLDLHRLYVNSLGTEGEQIRLNKVDFSNFILNTDTLTDAFITESYFENIIIQNCEIFEAKLCGCELNGITFKNVKFVDTDVSFCKFDNCKFVDSEMINCETYHTLFCNTVFDTCVLSDCFSFASLTDVIFNNIDFKSLVFYYSILNNIVLKCVKNLNMELSVASLNLGTFEEERIVSTELSIQYFKNNSIFVE